MTINTIKITPSIYSKESRDYQLISRLYDAIFNFTKMSSDSMTNLPLSKNVDGRFLDMTAKTIGFESKHNYNTDNLLALCSSFKKIVSYKGTKQAIEAVISMLLNSQNIKKLFKVYVYTDVVADNVKKPYTVVIYVPSELRDIVLLEDMMNYILPAGFVYEIYVKSISQDTFETTFSAESSSANIAGTSQQLSRVQAYTNSSLVTGSPVSGIDSGAVSGEIYINTKREGD